MNNSLAKITIIVPCLNAEKSIAKCINSILRQEAFLHELIIVDGLSTDATVDICLELIKNSNKTHLISETDRGQSDAMNKGLVRATGNIIGFVNADDFLDNLCLSTVKSNFEMNSNADMVVGWLSIEESGGSTLHKPSTDIMALINYSSYAWPLNPACYFYKAYLHDIYGFYPIHNHTCMDYWFLLRACKYSRTVHIPLTLGTYTIHGNNKSRVLPTVIQDIRECRRDFVASVNSLPLKTAYIIVLSTEMVAAMYQSCVKKALRLVRYCQIQLKSSE